MKDACYVKLFQTGKSEWLEAFQSVAIEKEAVVRVRIRRFRKPDIDFRIAAAVIPGNGTDGIIRFAAVIPDKPPETVLHVLLDQATAFT